MWADVVPRPSWSDPAGALWPTRSGQPLEFVAQIAHTGRLANGADGVVSLLFLFQDTTDVNCWAMVAQDPGAQTAEEHYAGEDRAYDQ